MSDFRDDKGDIVMATPNVLITGIYYNAEAEKICGPNAGSKEPGTAENDANIYSGLRHIYHPMITGKKWFLADKDLMDEYLNWYNARVPSIKTEVDFDTEVQKYATIGMWSYGFDNWQFIAGSSAD